MSFNIQQYYPMQAAFASPQNVNLPELLRCDAVKEQILQQADGKMDQFTVQQFYLTNLSVYVKIDGSYYCIPFESIIDAKSCVHDFELTLLHRKPKIRICTRNTQFYGVLVKHILSNAQQSLVCEADSEQIQISNMQFQINQCKSDPQSLLSNAQSLMGRILKIQRICAAGGENQQILEDIKKRDLLTALQAAQEAGRGVQVLFAKLAAQKRQKMFLFETAYGIYCGITCRNNQFIDFSAFRALVLEAGYQFRQFNGKNYVGEIDQQIAQLEEKFNASVKLFKGRYKYCQQMQFDDHEIDVLEEKVSGGELLTYNGVGGRCYFKRVDIAVI